MDAILARMPQVALIDELAHTNIEGSRFAKRYEDVLLLLDNKIDVLSTINIQHVESLAPRVQALTGISVRELVPDWVLDRADEIVISDLTPEALVTRLRRGDIYPPERVERSLANFFRRGNLIALREMALQRVTRAVDRNWTTMLREAARRSLDGRREGSSVHKFQSASTRSDCARNSTGGSSWRRTLRAARGKRARRRSRAQANAGIEPAIRYQPGRNHRAPDGSDTARVTGVYIREHRITQAIVGRSALRGLRKYLYYLAIQKFMSEAPHVDLHIVTQESH